MEYKEFEGSEFPKIDRDYIFVGMTEPKPGIFVPVLVKTDDLSLSEDDILVHASR